MTRRWQNKVAESTATLPIAAVIATVLWCVPLPSDWRPYALGWLVCALTTYIIIETSNKQALLRLRSRIISTVFVLVMAASNFLHPISSGSICQLCLAISFYYVLHTCDHPRPEPRTYYTFLFLSAGSLLWAPMLWLTPVVLWSQGVYLRSLSWRGLSAALIGVLTPYVLWATALTAIAIATLFTQTNTGVSPFTADAFAPFLQHTRAIIAPLSEPFLSLWDAELPLPYLATFGITLLLSLTGLIHYYRKSYDDKIRVRMCHYTYLSLQVVIMVWIVLQPVYFLHLYPLWLITVAPAAGHYIGHSHTWLSNAWFVILTLLLAAVAVITLTY